MNLGKFRAIAPFTLIYLLAFGVFVAIRGNLEFAYYGAVMAFLIVLVLMLDRAVNFTKPVLWGLSVWGLLHLAGGNVPVPSHLAEDGAQDVLYSMWIFRGVLKYDHLVHFFGFFVSTFVCHQTLRRALKRPDVVTAGLACGLALMSMGLGAANELVEFMATLIIPDTNVGGYENTGWDLVSNTFGALTGAAILWRRHPPAPDEHADDELVPPRL